MEDYVIRLVAIDMDGTLLNSNKKLSKENQKTIEDYAKKGVMFSFCTGRVMNEIEIVSAKLPEVKYAITCNGSLVYDISDRECPRLIYGDTLSIEEVRTIYEFAETLEFDMMFELQADGVVYADKKCIENPEKYGVGYIRELIQRTRVPVDNMQEYIYERSKDVGKLNIFFPNTNIRNKALKSFKKLNYEFAYSEPTNIDINQKGSNKGRGLRKLVDYLELTKDEVMVIGDNFNDLEMLQATPNSVAMANAPEEVKKYAKFTTLSNDQNGVAYAIKKYC